MKPRQAFFACLERSPPALFEAALWIAAEHDPAVQPLVILQDLISLEQQVNVGMPMLPADELGQPLLRRMNDLGFAQDEFTPLRPAAALLDKVLQRKRGQPLAMGLIAMELAIDGAATKLDHALEHLFGKLQGKPRAAAKNQPINKVNEDALEQEFLENENAVING